METSFAKLTLEEKGDAFRPQLKRESQGQPIISSKVQFPLIEQMKLEAALFSSKDKQTDTQHCIVVSNSRTIQGSPPPIS
jgi:hypothetical protein